jgi:hypothetical protein
MECLIEQLEQQVQQLERDATVKQQQQEELTSMCAQVSARCQSYRITRHRVAKFAVQCANCPAVCTQCIGIHASLPVHIWPPANSQCAQH